MTYRDEIANEYFEWMYHIVCDGRYSKKISYRKLLMHLHNTEFIYCVPRDENRAYDGTDLRYRFTFLNSYDDNDARAIEGPCSVLEMMIALAIRCEENIMDDPDIGDRTGQWFWGMITNLGLSSMTDIRYDKRYVNEVLDRFLYREYESDGRGGLFTVRNCHTDLRTVEIWYQMCWYLDNIT